MVGLGTICSVTINGIFLKAGIPVASRFGGVVETANGKPLRFVSLISYDGSSLDPLEVFIKSKMTRVVSAVGMRSGNILASFREIPVVCWEEAQRLAKKVADRGIKGILLIGDPNRSLLEMPVGIDRVGMVVVGTDSHTHHARRIRRVRHRDRGLPPRRGPGEGGPRLPCPRLGDLRRHRLLPPLGDPLPRGPHEEPVHREDLHQASQKEREQAVRLKLNPIVGHIELLGEQDNLDANAIIGHIELLGEARRASKTSEVITLYSVFIFSPLLPS
jgi:hypothetical protein